MNPSVDKKHPIGKIVNIVRYDVIVDRELNQIDTDDSNVFDGLTIAISDFDCTNLKVANIDIQPVICTEILFSSLEYSECTFKFQSLTTDEIFTAAYRDYDEYAFFWKQTDNSDQVAYQDILAEIGLFLNEWHNNQPKSVLSSNTDLGEAYHQALTVRTLCLLLSAHYQRFSGEELLVVDTASNQLCNTSEFNEVYKLISRLPQSNNQSVMRERSVIEFLNESFIHRIDFKN